VYIGNPTLIAALVVKLPLKAMRASAGYKEGDPDAVTAY
jgi:hypothetical protein